MNKKPIAKNNDKKFKHKISVTFPTGLFTSSMNKGQGLSELYPRGYPHWKCEIKVGEIFRHLGIYLSNSVVNFYYIQISLSFIAKRSLKNLAFYLHHSILKYN